MENDATKTTTAESEGVENGQQAGQTGDNSTAGNAGTGAAAGGGAAVGQQAATSGKTYTDEQLADLKAQWQRDYEQTQSQAKDFEKMTPEQQAQKRLDNEKAETARLKAELADRDLTDYARGKIVEAELPADALAFVKGKDTADTDARIKTFSAMLAAGVQAGVEKRFKGNGYTPRRSAAGKTEEASKKRARGVTYNDKK